MSIKTLNNLESVGDMIGSLEGIAQGLDSQSYTAGIIKQAHGKAANAFNVAAAATAATGKIQHVFEFGTAGVTRGPVKFHDPTSQAARLWVHQIEGVGGRQDIKYYFRPAVNRNPQLTTERTGIPSKYLRKLSRRKYVFRNKAFVMESGMTVKRKSHQTHGFLFLPTPGDNAPRHFVLWNTKTKGLPNPYVPGRSTRGNFQTFWLTWWGREGQYIMDKDMRLSVENDIWTATVEAARRARTNVVKPPQAVNVHRAATRSRGFMSKLFGRNRR